MSSAHLARRSIVALAALFATYWCVGAHLRYFAVHNRTFDLAFYARFAWGMARGSLWEPMTNASGWGLHISPVVGVLGLIARATGGTASVLLVAQSIAAGAAVLPLHAIGTRHLGARAGLVLPLAYLLHPNLSIVLTQEFHPGTVALLPIAFLADAVDRAHVKHAAFAVLGIAMCREDIVLIGALAGLVLATRPAIRKHALVLFAASTLYVGLFAFVLHPMHAPANGSLTLHFGPLGQSSGAVAHTLITRPMLVVSHLATLPRVLYIFKVTAPMLCVPVASLFVSTRSETDVTASRVILLACPILAINLLSSFPTTLRLDSHYLTPALPLLAAALAIPLARYPKLIVPVLAAIALSHVLLGGTPLSRNAPYGAFRKDSDTSAARHVLRLIPGHSSVQAPEELLAQVAERPVVRRGPPPDVRADWVILDVRHRARFQNLETLLRTFEEPNTRAWLAKEEYSVVAAQGPYVLLNRARTSPLSEKFLARYRSARRPEDVATKLCECLSVLSASFAAPSDRIELRFLVTASCPADLALRIGVGERPTRVDLIADGLYSPAKWRTNQVIVSRHLLSAEERSAIDAVGLRVGVLRESGARPDRNDPTSVAVPVRVAAPAFVQ